MKVKGQDAAETLRKLRVAPRPSLRFVELCLILDKIDDAASAAKKINRTDLSSEARQDIDWAVVFALYRKGRYDEVVRYANKLQGREPLALDFVYRHSVLRLWDTAIRSKSIKAAFPLLDQIGQFAAHETLILRCLGQIVPLCKKADEQSRIREFAERIKRKRFRSEKSQSALSKVLKKLGGA